MSAVELFKSAIVIGVNTDITGDFQALLNNVSGTHIGVFEQCAG